jgi:hypothetical protein
MTGVVGVVTVLAVARTRGVLEGTEVAVGDGGWVAVAVVAVTGVTDGAFWVRLAMTVAAAWVLIALKVGRGSTVAAAVDATVGATLGATVAVGLLHPTNKPARVNTTKDFHMICFILITIFLLTNIEGVFVAFCGIHDTAKTIKTPSLLPHPARFWATTT